jgi:uncharacterized membrane-anchored protein YitT (DUF2179 family)
MDNIYPEWKKVAWRFLRVFISAFLFAGSMVLINAQPAALSSWSAFLNTLVWPFLLAGGVAGINAVGKLLRDLFGTADKTGLVDKLPF